MDHTAGQAQNNFRKPPFDLISKAVSTSQGVHRIKGPVSPEWIAGCQLSEGLCCFRPSSHQHRALIELCKQPDGLIFVAACADKIFSYLSFQKPDFPWWKKRCFPQLLELGVMETSPCRRKSGLITAILDNVFRNPEFVFFEDFIIIAIQTVDGWDLERTGLSPWAYRKLMLDLFKKYGFTPWETDDPEIKEHPCNTLLARIGKNTGAAEINYFANCCQETR